MTMLIGPHVEKQDVWKYDICQLFLYTPRQYLNEANYQHMIGKFPKKPLNYDPKGKIYVIHTGYVNNIQSTDKNNIKKSLIDLECIIKSSKILFPPESKVYINNHLMSSKPIDKGLKDDLMKVLSTMPENMKFLIEHTSPDNFENFLKVFVPWCDKKIGLTFDTAHIHGSGYSIDKLLEYKDYVPDLIHLNGNMKSFGSRQDEHTAMCQELDKLWTKQLLAKFLRKYSKIPMIVEIRQTYPFSGEMETINRALNTEIN